MKNIEVRLAFVVGVALPLLETLRRRTNFSPIAMYVDDYIAGILLVIAARTVIRGKSYGPAFLAGAKGVFFALANLCFVRAIMRTAGGPTTPA